MQVAIISMISVEDRQRKEIAPAQLLELKRSIASKGLFHPPVLSSPAPLYKLIVGERRLRAMSELHQDGVPFFFNGEQVPKDHIPYALIGDLTSADLQEAELEENILRVQLTWLEEAEARAKIHAMRTEKAIANSTPLPTLADTAKYIVSVKGLDPKQAQAETNMVHRSLSVVAHKNDPDVMKAPNFKAAYRVVLDKQERFFKAKLASATIATDSNYKLIKGDCIEEMKKLPHNSFDLIFSDPPYGINADTMKADSKHHYKDDPEHALRICKEIIAQGFNLTKNKATLMLWTDIEHFITLRNFAGQQGWTCWRAPIIWSKGTQGHAPWGRAGFTRTYEILLFAVKGQKELYLPGGPDIIPHTVASASKKVHAAEKPVELLSYLLSKSAIDGQSVLDPCCGSGPIFAAAHKQRLKATGIEISPDYQQAALARIGDLTNGTEEEADLDEEEDEDDDDENEAAGVPDLVDIFGNT